MKSRDEVSSFMDLLDLDEEVIDSRLKTIMDRNTFTKQHLTNAIHLLRYKNLINLQDGSECDNQEEITFATKIMLEVYEENIDNVCMIVNIVLGLNKSTIVSNSEHLFQQILSNINLPSRISNQSSEGDFEDENSLTALLNLKLCDSILDAVIRNGEKLSLPFLETPLENVLAASDDKLKIYFLNNIVPKIFMGVMGYNILDRIWNYIRELNHISYENAIKILSCLSEFYLPVPDNKRNIKFMSEIVFQYEFWNILLNGLKLGNPASRKSSVYLIKRAIDSLIALNKDIHISCETNSIFNWIHKDTKVYKENWDNFFILIDSLEEKQSNIVLPSLLLFETIKYIDNCWMNCAFNIGLKHDNTQVRIKCIEYRLKSEIENISDAMVLLEAFNDINLYDQPNDTEDLKNKVVEALNNKNTFTCIIKALPNIKWSPIPLFHISDMLSKQNVDLSSNIEAAQLNKIVVELLKIPCNDIPIRHAVKMNITYFVVHCCRSLQWEDFINIYSLIEWDMYENESFDQSPFILAIKTLNLDASEKDRFFKTICNSYENIEVGLLYLENHMDDFNIFMEHANKKIKKIHDINSRQYSNKTECFSDVIYVTHLHLLATTPNDDDDNDDGKIKEKDKLKTMVTTILSGECQNITAYIGSLVQEIDVNLSIDEISMLFKGFESMAEIKDDKVKENLLVMYRQMIIILSNENVDLNKKLMAIFITEMVTKKLYASDKNRIFSLKQILHFMKITKIKEAANTVDIGRSRNAFFEKTCEIVYRYLEPYEYRDFETEVDDVDKEHIKETQTIVIKENLKDLVDYVEKVIECGGYGCLKWILKIMNKILPEILNDDTIEFNTVQYIDRMWKEIEELKSNNQYNSCIREFVRLISKDALLKRAMFNNIILLYSSKIVEYGYLKNIPLHALSNELYNINITEDYGQIIYVLCDILLFFPVPKKDHRLADNIALQTLRDTKYKLDVVKIDKDFNYDILFIAIVVLSGIRQPVVFETIASIIVSKIENHFKTKQRYHGNSQSHRFLLIGVQHLLFLPLLHQGIFDSEHISSWLIDFLGKMPHQPSVKICLEWYIALRLYSKNIQLNQNVVEMMNSKNIPLTSQFMILYWTLKHKISIGIYNQEEFEYVMDFLLSHTMGQMFNIRLNAQYLATEIFKKCSKKSEKYVYIIEVIQKTFIESSKDKNFVKLKEDFFINNFDIVKHYTPSFIYYFLPRYCDIGNNEDVSISGLKLTFGCINRTAVMHSNNTEFKNEWHKLKIPDDEVFKYELHKRIECSKCLENSDMMGTIQKKYIPWKNMSDIDIFETGKKKEITGELIVVASLIDKLPNLGGMARTSEVFGVKTYVVDSLRHIQDKTFQGLSVSAERWVNIEEVRPGPPLKEYLMQKKGEGYSVVAAEQTSTSVQLQKFKFPKKTLLLLGHEKEGIPCDLLPMMDYCVEIPQQGFIRSLNVHVTAAIFVWEYSRQNIL